MGEAKSRGYVPAAHAPFNSNVDQGPACIPELRQAVIASRPEGVTCLGCQRLMREQGYRGPLGVLPENSTRVLVDAQLLRPDLALEFRNEFRERAATAGFDHIGFVQAEYGNEETGPLVHIFGLATETEQALHDQTLELQGEIEKVIQGFGGNVGPDSWERV